jgi:4-hydroxy-tetrahydrodipicolinate reductase
MKTALIGYGRMGKIIENTLLQRGHEVVAKFDREGIDEKLLKEAEVAIEFTQPEAAFGNIATCIDQGIPVVIGTTGWLQHYDEAADLCKARNSAMLFASNFSLGVNLFFALNKRLAELMAGYLEYQLELKEIHHTGKRDAPSGTAISLAEQIIAINAHKTGWTLEKPTQSDQIQILAERLAGIPGTHEVKYSSNIDDIEIRHTAHSREGFALGAVLAAEFLKDKHGVFTMEEVLKL